MITHDRFFLDNITEWILELDRGKAIPYEGNYSKWLIQKQKRIELEAKHENARLRRLKSEVNWISSSPKARQSKSKARINNYESLLNKENIQVVLNFLEALEEDDDVQQVFHNMEMTEEILNITEK